MYICPDCRGVLDERDYSCSRCAWLSSKNEDGIRSFLSEKDKKSSFFLDYLTNYEAICRDDLSESIQPQAYLDVQTDYLVSYIGDLTDKIVCEVGVGQGLLYERLSGQTYHHYVGVDICVDYLKRLRRDEKNEFIVANAENLPFHDEFDVMIIADILEHVLNVGDFLASANRALKASGRFVVKVPYLEDISSYSTIRGCVYDHVHLRNFSKESLQVLLEGAGFEVERYFFDGFWLGRVKRKITESRILNCLFGLFKRANKISASDTYIKTKVNSTLACFFMRPAEVTAVCRKVRDVF